MLRKKTSLFKIGLYVRASKDDLIKSPEGTIKNQEERLREFINYRNKVAPFGEVTGIFVDQAISGKNINRPAVQRLIQGIKAREIDLVMVSELSRLSRSIRDFAHIWDLMQDNGCGFLSLREQFDTTTAAGEMVLFTLANAAQFERKQTSERIRANFHTRAKRGLFNGGAVPAGYSLDPEKKGYLIVDEKEAEVIREVFKTFNDVGTVAATAKKLNDRGHRLPRGTKAGGGPRLGYFTVGNTYKTLTNKAYIGERVYLENGEKTSAKAVWPAIITRKEFEKTRSILSKNWGKRVKTNSKVRFPFLLSTLCFCGRCGESLCGKTANGNGGKVPYYEHGWAVRKQAGLSKKVYNCRPIRFPARIIEPLVWDRVVKLISNADMAKKLLEEANVVHESQANVLESDRLRKQLRSLESQLDTVAEHLTKIPTAVSPVPIFNQMEKLQKEKDGLIKNLETLLITGDCKDVPAPLKDFDQFLQTIKSYLTVDLPAEAKAKIVQHLVHRVEIFPDKIHYTLKLVNHRSAKRYPNQSPTLDTKKPAVKAAGWLV